MKKIETYYKGSGHFVEAYEKKDLAEISANLNYAENRWYEEWVSQGSKDEGTCCGGKGIQIWYVAPRQRSADRVTFVNSPPCQGNVSAYKSVEPALKYLEDCEIEAFYYDGWMD